MKSAIKEAWSRKGRALPASGRLTRQHMRLRHRPCTLNILLLLLLLIVALLVAAGWFPPLAYP